MDGLGRLFPYVWRYRRRVLASIVLAMLVAAFWAVNLSFTFFVVKVLLQGQDLTEYVRAEIRSAEAAVDQRTARIEELHRRLQELEAASASAADRASAQTTEAVYEIHREQARQQSKLSSATRRLYVLSWVDTHVLPRLPADRFDLYALILGLLLVSTFIKGLCVYSQDVVVGSVVHLVLFNVRREFFRRVLRLDYHTVTGECGNAELTARFTNDINELGNGLTLLGGKVIREPLKAAACVLFAFFINWRLTLLAVLFVPLIGAVFYRFGRSLKRANRRTMEAVARLCKVLDEALRSFKIVTAYHRHRQHRKKFYAENRSLFAKAMQVVSVDALTSPTTELMGMIAVFLAVLPGAYLVLRQTTEIWNIRLASQVMDIAQLSTMYALLAGVLDPVRKLSSLYTRLKRASAASDRVFGLIDREPTIQDPPHPRPVPSPISEILFHDVTFQYRLPDAETERPPVLRDVNLTIPAGQTLAIVGENGSGKSTLLNLLPRFYDPNFGSVRINGIDIREFRLRDLRERIGVVTQEVVLFDDTIANNVRYGRPGATDAEVREALRQVHLLDFVEQLPDGIHSPLGKLGDALSGGQRQRITLARALIKDPDILILDESTAAVDAQGENLIYATLQEVAQNRTCLLVTHSITPAVLRLVRRIVVMADGQILADGTHEKLLADSPAYRRLYHAHRDFDADPVAGPFGPESGAAGQPIAAAPTRSPLPQTPRVSQQSQDEISSSAVAAARAAGVADRVIPKPHIGAPPAAPGAIGAGGDTVTAAPAVNRSNDEASATIQSSSPSADRGTPPIITFPAPARPAADAAAEAEGDASVRRRADA